MSTGSTILITGGTGLIGRALTARLLDEGYRVHVLTRSPADQVLSNYKEYHWDPYLEEIDDQALEGVTHVYNMAGANINGKRWTREYKKEIRDSRVLSTRFLVDQLIGISPVPRLISFSGVGIYDDRGDMLIDEHTPIVVPSEDFLSEVCYQWEQEALMMPSTILRIAPVLAREGGALPEILKQSSRGVIGMVGSSHNFFSWIHLQDMVEICMHCLSSDTPQYINATAPSPVTNRELMTSVKKNFSLWGPLVTIPCAVIRLALGEVSTELCKSLRAKSAVLEEAGFQFKFGEIEKALQDLS